MIASGLSNIIILVVGAAWAAVLIPPLLRSRVENRPGSSVVDFRRQLATLQRTVPTRQVSPMRSATRPLAPGQRPGAAPRAPHGAGVQHLVSQRSHHTGVRTHAPVQARAVSQRELLRQRRQNVLFGLVAVTLGSAFLAFTSSSAFFTYVFVFSAISLAGYCYKLVQIKQYSGVRAYGEDWFRAA